MEAIDQSTPILQPETALRPRLRPSQRKNVASPKRSKSTREVRTKRISPKSAFATGSDTYAGKPTPKPPRTNTSPGRPIVPATERASYGEKLGKRGKKEKDGEKWEIAPDGSSAGREGRQFTVANVGNNGRIYLRPSVRPAHQRFPQPDFIFPATPPGTSGLDYLGQPTPEFDDGGLSQGQWTPIPRPSPRLEGKRGPADNHAWAPPTRHRRAMSDSTIQDTNAAHAEAGALKIVISKPGPEHRPKTTEDAEADVLLDISIPSWRLGVPHFTSTGTPHLGRSSYSPSEEYHTMRGSLIDHSQKDLNTSLPRLGSRRPSTLKVPRSRLSRHTQPRTPTVTTAKANGTPLRLTFVTSHLVIEPAMFDDLTFKPACDDVSIVRYTSSTGVVSAATPARLVAEITSPSFLDYELISDFFLTFRAFLEPESLLQMLVARLRWATGRRDEIGMIVHVRSFVALRHWILNYFVDDFFTDYSLRIKLCESINDFIRDLVEDHKHDYRPQLRIIYELKKCWRRVCAQYWESSESEESVDDSTPIFPGGFAELTDSNPDLEASNSTPRQSDSLCPLPEATATSFYSQAPGRVQTENTAPRGVHPPSPDSPPAADVNKDFGPGSPTSMSSMDVISCSFPSKINRPVATDLPQPLRAHPVTPTMLHDQSGPIATTPRALVGKRVRANQPHRRNDSLPDSLRSQYGDPSFRDQEFLMTVPQAGSLVRGNILPPSQSFVDYELPPQVRPGRRATTVVRSQDSNFNYLEAPSADGMSGRGMKRLIGSVRRALSTRGGHTSTASFSSYTRTSDGTMTVPGVNGAPGTAVVPQASGALDGNAPRIRVDLLGAAVAEDFHRVVREDAAAAETEILEHERESSQSDLPGGVNLEYSAAYMDSTTFELLPPPGHERAPSEAGLTVGSKSILIVDGTVTSEVPKSRDGAATANSSVEAFGDTLMPRTDNLTPPITPPARFDEAARRSSHLLNEKVQNYDRESFPSLESGSVILRDNAASSQSSIYRHQRAVASLSRSRQRPPISAGITRMHMRSRSSRTQQSLDSVLQGRKLSISSDVAPPSTAMSLDETTCSEGSLDLDGSEMSQPAPKRVLRRRPGGDLKAFTNVSEIDKLALRRSQSLGSLYTDSVRTSRYRSLRRNSTERIDSIVSRDHQRHSHAFSVGQLADKPQRRELSFCSTHSSKPAMRRSFEAEAKKLARIPDDDDDGGVESALLKLEGKYHKTPKRLPSLPDALRAFMEQEDESRVCSFGAVAQQALEDHDHPLLMEDSNDIPTDVMDEHTSFADAEDQLKTPRPANKVQSFLSDASRESYISMPLLQGDPLVPELHHATKDWADKSILQDSDDDLPPNQTDTGAGLVDSTHVQYLPFDFDDGRLNRSEANVTVQEVSSPLEDQSFLDSDLSSEISNDEDVDYVGGVRLDATLPAHPLGSPVATSHFSPKPFVNLLDTSVGVRAVASSGEIVTSEHQLPPTPVTTPAGASRQPFANKANAAEESRKFSVHLPFILAFDSETLAQQFTLIEKDALNEIDWKELVDMDWKNATNHDSRSWVEFLRNNDAYGVEVVIARFNLVVKWAISEIVLTQHIEERARCLIKFIHTASHCRRYRNFATLAQLTIALSSSEISRLARTWELVPAQDMKTLKDLEALVTPMRNFFNLRAEMESSPDTRCIPFVGIYTHDLLYNAQRPSEIASSPTTIPLVNFERCRIGASVIKTLLRLLEASTQYTFIPIEGVTERCLWIGALSDDEIRRHSGNLE